MQMRRLLFVLATIASCTSAGPPAPLWEEPPSPIPVGCCKEVDVVCPIDGTKFTAIRIESSNDWGGVDGDYCAHALGGAPIVFHAWTCPCCCYTGLAHRAEVDFAPARAERRNAILGKLRPRTLIRSDARQCDIPGHAKFDLLAQCLLLADAPACDVANAWLWASWVVRVKGAIVLPGNPAWAAWRESHGLDLSPLELGKWINRATYDLDLIPHITMNLNRLKPADRRFAALGAAWLARDHGENTEAMRWIAEVQRSPGLDDEIREACTRMTRSIMLEREYQAKALEQYERGLSETTHDDEARSRIAYILGELCRRLDRREQASQWFDRALVAADRDLRDLIACQKARMK